MVVQDEELFPAVLHDVLAEMVDEVGDGDGFAVLVVGGDDELVLPLVREQHLEAAPEQKSAEDFFDLAPFPLFRPCMLFVARHHLEPAFTGMAKL